jgi:hypothetical protein
LSYLIRISFDCFPEVLNTGELQREDYLPLKLPPLPSIDSAVESWVSGASNRNNNNNNDSTPIYTAGASPDLKLTTPMFSSK